MYNIIVKLGGRAITTLAGTSLFRGLITWGRTKVVGLGKIAVSAGLFTLIVKIIDLIRGDKSIIDSLRRELKKRASDQAWPDDDNAFLAAVQSYAAQGSSQAAIVLQAFNAAGVTIDFPEALQQLFAEASPDEATVAGLNSLLLDERVQSIAGDANPATATTSPVPTLFKEKLRVYRKLRGTFSAQNLRDLQTLMFNIEAGDWEDLESYH